MKVWVLELVEKKTKGLSVRVFKDNVAGARALAKIIGGAAALDVNVVDENLLFEWSLYESVVEEG